MSNNKWVRFCKISTVFDTENIDVRFIVQPKVRDKKFFCISLLYAVTAQRRVPTTIRYGVLDFKLQCHGRSGL